MYRLLASRGLPSIAAGLAALLVAAIGYVIVAQPLKPMQRYCARMPDAIGLYPGTHVRVRGVVIGSVADVRPENNGVRVDFDIDAAHPLHGDVAATTMADTLVADRDLAVLPGASADPRWDPSRCITRTLTPKSITETLQAASTLAHQLGATDDPELIRNTLDALHTATAGTGPQVNQLITRLGSAVGSPDSGIEQIGRLIDALSSLSATISAEWDELHRVLTRAPDVFDQINNEIFAHLSELVDSLRIILPWADDLTRQYGGAILGGLDATVPYLHMIAANTGTLQDIVARIPALAATLTRAVDPAGNPVIAWSPPKSLLPQSITNQVCGALDPRPGGCPTADALANLDMLSLALGLAGTK